MRPKKVETPVHCSVCHVQVFAGFSGYGNSIYNKERLGLTGLITLVWQLI